MDGDEKRIGVVNIRDTKRFMEKVRYFNTSHPSKKSGRDIEKVQQLKGWI